LQAAAKYLWTAPPPLKRRSAAQNLSVKRKDPAAGKHEGKDTFKWTKVFYPEFNSEYAGELAEKFKLDTKKHIKALSTGFDSILKIVLAMSANTPYILLDEPVLGLDANNRDLFYRLLIEKYSERPCTVVISTHLIEEVSAVVEDIAIIKDGRIIRNESRDALLSKGYTASGTTRRVDEYAKGKMLSEPRALAD
jgi:ABC-type multidrug transport system, ATPase component